MKKEIGIIGIGFLLVSGFIVGFLVNEVTDNRKLDGLWLKNYNQTEAKAKAQERDKLGDWVCVNIKGMTYNRALEVCNHEVGHEIFAEVCEKNMSKCLEVVN